MLCVRGYDFPLPPVYVPGMGRSLADRIRAIRQTSGLNQTEFAEKLGTTQSTVTRWEAGSVPGGAMLKQIANFANTSVERLLGSEDLAATTGDAIPVVGYVGAGAQVLPFNDYPHGDGMDHIERPPFVHGRAVAVEVQGDSLFPVAEDGWRLVYTGERSLSEEDVLNRLCVVMLLDGRCLVKRVTRGTMPQRYHLLSTNAPVIEDVEIEWAARVKAIVPR